MSNKSFGIYSSEDFAVEENDQLVVEIAKSHIAVIAKKHNHKNIAGYELFNYNHEDSQDVNSLFNSVLNQSKIFGKAHYSADVYFNHECCLPVPIFVFNKQIAADYLQVVFGEDPSANIHFEHLSIEPGIMNVFRIKQAWQSVLNQQFSRHTIHHTYSNILQHLSRNNGVARDAIHIQFYNTSIIVAVFKSESLQLIQTFVYDIPEDVLYHLLNITRQFNLDNSSLTVHISGMIDLEFKLYRELITYFTNVVVENVNEKNLLLHVNEFPLHYFTPFFNLAL